MVDIIKGVYQQFLSGGYFNYISILLSNTGLLITFILDLILLITMKCPAWGLKFIPIYGDYYMYKMLLPHKRKLNLQYLWVNIISLILLIITYVSLFIMIASFFDIIPNNSIITIIFFSFLVAYLVSAIISIVTCIRLKFEMAERFNYNKYFGILFFFIPVVGSILELANAKNVMNIPDSIERFNNNFEELKNDI